MREAETPISPELEEKLNNIYKSSTLITHHSWMRFHSISAEGRDFSTTLQVSGARMVPTQY